MNVYTAKRTFFFKKILLKGIILLLILLLLNIFQYQIKDSFYRLSSPLLSLLSYSARSTNSFFGSIFNAQGIAKENNNLKEENQKLLYEIALLKETLTENIGLNEAELNTKEDNFKILQTYVIGLDVPNGFILINKGSKDGVSENMPIISSKKVLYGRVFKVYKNFSQAMLLSNKNSVLNAKIQNEDPSLENINGVVKSHDNISLYFDLVSSDSEIKKGDIILTSGFEGIFPKDLLIGKVVSIDKDDQKPFQTAQIQPFLNQQEDSLFLITNYRQE